MKAIATLLVTASAATLLAAPNAVALPQETAVTRPNVLVIETDDMRADDVRFMPNVRRLIAQRGLTFANSFAPNPLCCPSRTSFLTGKYSHNHRVLSHVEPYGFGAFNDATTVATHLQDAGYQTALIGKYLNGYGSQPVYSTGQPSLTYVPPGWTQWHAASDYGRFPSDSALWGGTYNYSAITLNVNGDLVGNRGRYSTNVLAQHTRSVISGFSTTSKPWFVWWTPVAPHFGSPVEKDDPLPVRRSDGTMSTFETPARPAWVRGKFNKVIRHGIGVRRNGTTEADISDKPGFLQTPELNAAERRAELKSSRQRAEALFVLDKEIGATLAQLKALRALDRTYIVFTSDNGYFLGEHRKRYGKILSHEPSLRVPLIVAGPDVPHGVRYDPVMTIDMAPTISDWTDTGPMPRCDGESLRDVIAADRGWDRVVVTEGLDAAVSNGVPMTKFASGLNISGIRVAGWSYIRYGNGDAEMYDLRADPLQLRNVYADPAYSAMRERLQEVWSNYQSCADKSCRTPLPADLRATPAQERDLTLHQRQATADYYR